ncbi:hypothetical protein BV20DRAFT_945170 [Pilatotrama ljubarskyi]|nr:hypothetical protein BV20DRAFT_945170 [Pilatotrama ljubarskyi]
MVGCRVWIKAGPDGAFEEPGENTWLVVSTAQQPQPVDPTSTDPVPAGEYKIVIYGQGLALYFRYDLNQLNWDNEEKTKRDPTFATLIRGVSVKCSITGVAASQDRIDALQAAHICPVTTNIQMWNVLAPYVSGTQVLMTKPFLECVWNGVLLRADVHIAFDAFALSVVQVPGNWDWRVVAFHPSFVDYMGSEFKLRQPDNQDDQERLVATLQLHFYYCTQKLAGFPSPG